MKAVYWDKGKTVIISVSLNKKSTGHLGDESLQFKDLC